MSEKEASNFQRLLDAILDKGDVDPGILKEVLQVEASRLSEPTEVQIAKITANTEAAKPWYQWLPWAALFTLLGGIATALISNVATHLGEQETRQHEISLERLRHESEVVGRLLIIEDLPEDRDEEEERRARVCFAVRFGLIQVPDYFLTTEENDRVARRDEVLSFVSQYECDTAPIPSAVPGPATASLPESSESFERPNVSLTMPADLDAASPADRILELAILEHNRGVHEVLDFQRVGEYWRVLGLNLDGRDRQMPWSGAFTSWLVDQSGNPHNWELSAQNSQLWLNAFQLGASGEANIAFSPDDIEPRRGDVVFVASPRATAEELEALMVGEPVLISSTSGVILNVVNDRIAFISGNDNHAVRVQSFDRKDPRIYGYVRQ